MKNIHLGVNLSFAMNRYVEPEEWAKIVKEDVGVKYVQFFTDLLDPFFSPSSFRSRMCQRIKELCGKKSLKIHSVFTGTSPHCFNLLLHPEKEMRKFALKWYGEVIKMTSQMGSSGFGSFLGAFSQKDLNNKERKKVLTEELIENWHYLASLAKREGLKFLLFEPMSCKREPPSTIKETKWFYQKLNEHSSLPFKLCLDLGHGRKTSGETVDDNPYAWLEEFKEDGLTVHLQQTDRIVSRHWPFTKDFNQRGIIKAEKVIDILKNNKGIYLFIEINYPPFEPFDEYIKEDLKKSVEYWKKALKGHL